jgi:hypothetical protein
MLSGHEYDEGVIGRFERGPKFWFRGRSLMRKFLPALLLTGTFLACSVLLASACGDKLLVLGAGAKFGNHTSPHHALIIVYVPDSVPQSAAVNDPQFQAALRKAGVKLHLVQQEDVLAEAVQSGRYDIILADLQDAAQLDKQVTAADVNTVVMPVVYKGAELNSAAATPYVCVRKTSDKNNSCFSTIDKAIQLKLKRDEKQRRASKK